MPFTAAPRLRSSSFAIGRSQSRYLIEIDQVNDIRSMLPVSFPILRLHNSREA
jgi:hypothetical protein